MNRLSLHVLMLNRAFVAYIFLSVLNLRDEFKMLISVLAFVKFKFAFINYEDGSQGKIALLLIKL